MKVLLYLRYCLIVWSKSPSVNVFIRGPDMMKWDVKEVQLDSLTVISLGVTGGLRSCSTQRTWGLTWWSRLVLVWAGALSAQPVSTVEKHWISQDVPTLESWTQQDSCCSSEPTLPHWTQEDSCCSPEPSLLLLFLNIEHNSPFLLCLFF